MSRIPSSESPYQSNYVGRVSVSLTDETGDARTATITMKTDRGEAIAQRAALHAYLSDDAEGDGLCASAPSSGVIIGANGSLIEPISDKVFILISDAAGVVKITLTEVSTKTFYLVIILPDATLSVTPIAFA